MSLWSVDWHSKCLALGSDVDALRNRGSCVTSLHLYLYEEALEDTIRAMAIEPNAAVILLAHGTALLCCGKHGESIAALSQAVDLAPDNPSMWVNRGYAFLQIGRCRTPMMT